MVRDGADDAVGATLGRFKEVRHYSLENEE